MSLLVFFLLVLLPVPRPSEWVCRGVRSAGSAPSPAGGGASSGMIPHRSVKGAPDFPLEFQSWVFTTCPWERPPRLWSRTQGARSEPNFPPPAQPRPTARPGCCALVIDARVFLHSAQTRWLRPEASPSRLSSLHVTQTTRPPCLLSRLFSPPLPGSSSRGHSPLPSLCTLGQGVCPFVVLS